MPESEGFFGIQLKIRVQMNHKDMPRQQADDTFREFLAAFKTQPCPMFQGAAEGALSDHDFKSCYYYHDGNDRRRCPYSRLNQHLYQPVMCDENHLPPLKTAADISLDSKASQEENLPLTSSMPSHSESKQGGCPDSSSEAEFLECPCSHNGYELQYHPLRYKTTNCQFYYNCPMSCCPFQHHNEYRHSENEFYRFDLNTFKVLPCKLEYSHDKPFCRYYHSESDKRRKEFQSYEHGLCSLKEPHPSESCPYSHNKIEQVYHPCRYKSKFCVKYSQNKCPYGEFCSFAHSQQEISIPLLENMPMNLQFDLYLYKTVWCPLVNNHDRAKCLYAHNIQDYRRSPKHYDYLPERCPKWKTKDTIKSLDQAGCPQRMECNMCHGWKEYKYHPAIYTSKDYDHSKNGDSHSKNGDNHQLKHGEKHSYNTLYKKTLARRKQSSLQKTYQIKDEVIMKKLETGNPKGSTIPPVHKLEAIISKQITQNTCTKVAYNAKDNGLLSNGVPFFKTETSSFGSKTTKTKSEYHSQDKFSQMEERGSVDSFQLQGVPNNIECLSEQFNENTVDDDKLFKYFDTGRPEETKSKSDLHSLSVWLTNSSNVTVHHSHNTPRNEKRLRERISRSEDRGERFEVYYSNELSQLLDPILLEKLRKMRVNEIKLINMSQEAMMDLTGLTLSERQRLSKKLGESHTGQGILYCKSLQNIFKQHKREKLLQKMKTKKVKQDKLVNLVRKEINDLSFLTEDEKEELPQLLKEFTNNRDFKSLNSEIQKSLSTT